MHKKYLWQLNDLIFFIPGAKKYIDLILAPEVSLNSKPHVLAHTSIEWDPYEKKLTWKTAHISQIYRV